MTKPQAGSERRRAAGEIHVAGRRVDLDAEGYLRNLADWSEDIARVLARRENIVLEPAHWEMLHALREFYRRHELSPASRALVSWVKKRLGPEKGHSIYLMRLFGGSFAKSASRIAGLPKPDNCL